MPIWLIITIVVVVLLLLALAIAAGGVVELIDAIVEGIVDIIFSVFTD